MPAARLTTLLQIQQRPWATRAACRNVDRTLWPQFVTPTNDDDDDPNRREPSLPPDEVLAFCNFCDVRIECLGTALACGEVGVWGGTSTHQRRQLLRKITRRHCPGCGNEKLFTIPGETVDVCPSCGTSWDTSKPIREERSA